MKRVVEQVRAETEQWSQMQEMLGQVRDEMEELQASRDFWEDRALDYDHQIQLLHSAVSTPSFAQVFSSLSLHFAIQMEELRCWAVLYR